MELCLCCVGDESDKLMLGTTTYNTCECLFFVFCRSCFGGYPTFFLSLLVIAALTALVEQVEYFIPITLAPKLGHQHTTKSGQ